jgi:hypothetical protein
LLARVDDTARVTAGSFPPRRRRRAPWTALRRAGQIAGRAQGPDGALAAGIQERLPADRAEQRLLLGAAAAIRLVSRSSTVSSRQPSPARPAGPPRTGPPPVRLDGAPQERIAFPRRVGEAAVAGAGRGRGPAAAIRRVRCPAGGLTGDQPRAAASPALAAAASCPAGTGAGRRAPRRSAAGRALAASTASRAHRLARAGSGPGPAGWAPRAPAFTGRPRAGAPLV